MNLNEDKYRIMLSGYIDDELDAEEKALMERHLQDCQDCRKELEVFYKLKEVTGAMKYADIPEYVWEGYWKSIYRRFELGLGWILFSIGLMVILGFACFKIVEEFFINPEEPLLLKIGIAALAVGFIILLVSVIRERVFACKRDRYSEVNR